MTHEIKKYLKEFNDGTKKMFKEFFHKKTNKKQRANMWTFSRLISSFLTVICSILSIILSIPGLFILSGVITAFGAITDFFDGRSARKYNSSSDYGKLLDQVTDKVFSIMISINLALFNPLYLIIFIGEGVISIINIYYKSKYTDLKINSTKIGKIKQFPLFISLALGFLSPINNIYKCIANISVIITFIVQIVVALSYIIENNKLIKKLNKTALIETT